MYAFQGGNDGGQPNSAVIWDQAGNLYGTTTYGGDLACAYGSSAPRYEQPPGCGTVFKLSPDGTEMVLHAFGSNTPDGAFPNGYLTADSSGNLYGTTQWAGNRYLDPATIFEITPEGAETVLYTFPNPEYDPQSNLLVDAQGNLYGTTFSGGGGPCDGGAGCGTLFKLAPNGAYTMLYSFGGSPDGQYPSGALAVDAAGNIYGATEEGGANGMGAVFRVSPGGAETLLYSFKAAPDANVPQTGVIIDPQGNLYGATGVGGRNGDGSIFKIASSGAETVLYRFLNNPDGEEPLATPIMDASGDLFGTTYLGGTGGGGTAFELTPDGTETVLFSFGKPKKDGWGPKGGIALDPSGNLYGTTYWGGAANKGPGLVFKLTP